MPIQLVLLLLCFNCINTSIVSNSYSDAIHLFHLAKANIDNYNEKSVYNETRSDLPYISLAYAQTIDGSM